ncbi:hypothetical protein AB205_0081260, partial [Aquarana catesbeiana]
RGDLIIIKVKAEEDPCVRGDCPCKEEEGPPEISTDGQYRRYNLEEDPTTSDSSEESPITPERHPVVHSADLSSNPSTHGGDFYDHPPLATHQTANGRQKIFP